MANRPSGTPLIHCKRCDTKKPPTAFVSDKTRITGRFPWCKDCVRQSRRERPKRVTGTTGTRACQWCDVGLEGTHQNRRYCSESCKDKFQRAAMYGLSPKEYRELTADRCPICERKVKRWEIDHNHKTGETTGAVCRTCNGFLLAYSYHDVRIARNLLAFLEDPPVKRLFGERRYVGPPEVSQLHRMWAWNGEKRDEAA